MKPFVLQRGNCQIEVKKESGLYLFSMVRGGKVLSSEYVIEKDLDSRVTFLENHGWKTLQEKINKAKSESWYRDRMFELAIEKDR